MFRLLIADGINSKNCKGSREYGVILRVVGDPILSLFLMKAAVDLFDYPKLTVQQCIVSRGCAVVNDKAQPLLLLT